MSEHEKMRIAVLGAAGMLGQDLVEELGSRGLEVVGLDKPDGDITQPEVCLELLRRAKPCVVINCAAYTDVARAESERELAFAINATGAANVARSCAEINARCIYISTDYVFDGTKPAPYLENDAPNPLGVYGASKLEGERQTAALAPNHVIARTSWLYGARGRNFVTTMLGLARRGQPLRVVSDQVGAPTYTRDLSRMLADLALIPQMGIFHATNSGACSWYEFAQKIFSLSGVTPASLEPIASNQFVSPVVRPANSRLGETRLAALGIAPMPSWEDALERFLCEIGERRGSAVV